MINIWLALREEAVAELNGWAADPDSLTDDQRMVMGAILSHPDTQHIDQIHKRDADAGKQWTLYSMYLEGSQTVMDNLTTWLADYNGKAYIIGAWGFNGAQWTGQDGQPLYPIHSRAKKFMPDDVTYDQDGVETGRANATTNKQVNLMAGQAPRLYS